MGLLLRELTTCDTVVSSDDSLRELGVLEGPEAEKTGLEQFVICAVDVELTVAHCDQVWVLNIDIDTGDHTAFCFWTFKCKERL